MTAASSGPRFTGSRRPATSSTSQANTTNPSRPAINMNLVPTSVRARRSDQRGLCMAKFYAARALRGPGAPLELGRCFSTSTMGKNRGTDAQLLTMHELAAYLHLDE